MIRLGDFKKLALWVKFRDHFPTIFYLVGLVIKSLNDKNRTSYSRYIFTYVTIWASILIVTLWNSESLSKNLFFYIANFVHGFPLLITVLIDGFRGLIKESGDVDDWLGPMVLCLVNEWGDTSHTMSDDTLNVVSFFFEMFHDRPNIFNLFWYCAVSE